MTDPVNYDVDREGQKILRLRSVDWHLLSPVEEVFTTVEISEQNHMINSKRIPFNSPQTTKRIGVCEGINIQKQKVCNPERGGTHLHHPHPLETGQGCLLSCHQERENSSWWSGHLRRDLTPTKPVLSESVGRPQSGTEERVGTQVKRGKKRSEVFTNRGQFMDLNPVVFSTIYV